MAMTPRVVCVIASVETRGSGASSDDPVRPVTRLFTLTGDLIAEYDPTTDKHESAPVPPQGAK